VALGGGWVEHEDIRNRKAMTCAGISLDQMVRARLERSGHPIGGNDLLNAAQAAALGYTLVTDNEQEFRRIDELLSENWLR
jgi:hypothetical protein